MAQQKELTVKELGNMRLKLEAKLHRFIYDAIADFNRRTGLRVERIIIDQEAISWIDVEPHRCLDMVEIKLGM
jgi:hypothetical protein